MQATMTIATALTAAMALGAPVARAAQIIYQNDSFPDTPTGDAAVECGFAVGEKFGAIFVPDPADYPFTITSVRFALFPYRYTGSTCEAVAARTGIPVTIEIWNDPSVSEAPAGAAIYTGSEWSVESSSDAIVDLPVGTDAEMLVTSGVVRVAVTLTADDVKPIRDDDGLTPERGLIYDIGGTWHWSSDYMVDGDWLLRLVVDTQPLTEPDTTETVPDADTDAPLDVIDDEDVAPDVPLDVIDVIDEQDDPQEEGDVRLGGGGCSCTMADAPGNETIAGLALIALFGLAMALHARR